MREMKPGEGEGKRGKRRGVKDSRLMEKDCCKRKERKENGERE